MEMAAPMSKSILSFLLLTITGTIMESVDELSFIVNNLYLTLLPSSLSDEVDFISYMQCVLSCLVRPCLSCPIGSDGLGDGCGNVALEQHTGDT